MWPQQRFRKKVDMGLSLRIGAWHERETRSLTRCPGYYAADWEKHETIPGEYPLYVVFEGGFTRPMPCWICTGIASQVVAGQVFNGFGGLNFSSREIEPHDSKRMRT